MLLPIGNLDSANARVFESIIMDHISNDEQHLIVDFSHVDFIGSSGMRVILTATKKLNAIKGNLVLCEIRGFWCR